MPLVASPRERGLWLWTLAALTGIYATLGPARALADALRERNLLRLAFALGLAALVGAVAWRWLRKRPAWSQVGVALGVALVYLLILARIENPAERTHLVEYGVVAALIHQALLERARHSRVWAPAALAMILTAVFGLLDETIQAFLPSRFFDPADIFFNAFAGFMVVAARLAIAPQAGPGWRVWFLWLMAGSLGWGWGLEAATRVEPGGIQSLYRMPASVAAGYVGVAWGGILVGAMQWFVVRRHLRRAWHWMLASLAAAGVLAAAVFGLGAVHAEAEWVGGASLFGVVLGVLQWTVLRRQVRGAGWWVLASTVGWVVGMPIGDAVAWPALGAIYGATTGLTLVWLLRRERPGTRPVGAP